MSAGGKGLLLLGAFVVLAWAAFSVVVIAGGAGISDPQSASADSPSSAEPTAMATTVATVPEATSSTPPEQAALPDDPTEDPFGSPAESDPVRSQPGEHLEAREFARQPPQPQQDGETAEGEASRERPTEPRLSEVDLERAEGAAFNFVYRAYGYSGDNRVQYESYVNQAVIPDAFRQSPGADAVEEFASRVADTGVKSELVDQDFSVRSTSDNSAGVRADFELRDPSGTRRFTQLLEVRALESVWKVSRVGPLEAQ